MISLEKKIKQEKCEPPPPPHFKTHHCIVLPTLFGCFSKEDDILKKNEISIIKV